MPGELHCTESNVWALAFIILSSYISSISPSPNNYPLLSWFRGLDKHSSAFIWLKSRIWSTGEGDPFWAFSVSTLGPGVGNALDSHQRRLGSQLNTFPDRGPVPPIIFQTRTEQNKPFAYASNLLLPELQNPLTPCPSSRTTTPTQHTRHSFSVSI